MYKKCFIAGLPSAGKTTFLAALWNLINHAVKGSGKFLEFIIAIAEGDSFFQIFNFNFLRCFCHPPDGTENAAAEEEAGKDGKQQPENIGKEQGGCKVHENMILFVHGFEEVQSVNLPIYSKFFLVLIKIELIGGEQLQYFLFHCHRPVIVKIVRGLVVEIRC